MTAIHFIVARNTYNSSSLFVGNDYFCESAAAPVHGRAITASTLTTYSGMVKAVELTNNRCCQLNSPPWFTKVLPNTTSDNIELRLCLYDAQYRSNIALELLEIYVK